MSKKEKLPRHDAASINDYMAVFVYVGDSFYLKFVYSSSPVGNDGRF